MWKGGIKKYLGDEMILIGKDFWDRILLEDITFEEFKKIYYDSCREVGLNEKMDELIQSVIEEEN